MAIRMKETTKTYSSIHPLMFHNARIQDVCLIYFYINSSLWKKVARILLRFYLFGEIYKYILCTYIYIGECKVSLQNKGIVIQED